MIKLITFFVIIALVGLKTAFNQEVFKLTIVQPSPLTITLTDSIVFDAGEKINLDTMIHVKGDISFASEWEFDDGLQLYTIENPLLTMEVNHTGTYYLKVVDENNCTAIDSIFIRVKSGTGEILSESDYLRSVRVYPNPNTGSFDILIPECLPDYTIQVINAIGLQILNKALDCNGNEYREIITLPAENPGIYFLLVKKGSQIVYRQKIILFN